MFRLLILVLAHTAFLSATAIAADTPPSDASLPELLEGTEARKLVDNAVLQMDQLSEKTARDAVAGQALTAENQQAVRNLRQKLTTIFREELSWEKLEPMYLDIYRSSLTQDEVNGMLEFYKSDVGRAMTRKMPDIMQASVVEVQKRIPAMLKRMEEARNEFVVEMGKGMGSDGHDRSEVSGDRK